MDTDDIWNSLFGGGPGSMAERMFSEMAGLRGTDVRTFGYAAYTDSEGNRYVKEFGTPACGTDPSNDADGMFADVSLEDGTVRAVIEIPGVSKEDIVLEGTRSTLSISVDTDRKRFAKTLALPCDVDPDSAAAEYNNGILEVTLVPAAPPGSKKHISIR